MQQKTIDQRIGLRVRQALVGREMSQAALGVALRQSQAWVSRRLRGEVSFNVAELLLVGRLLDVPFEFLVDASFAALPDVERVPR